MATPQVLQVSTPPHTVSSQRKLFKLGGLFCFQHQPDLAIGVHLMDRYTFYLLEFLEDIHPASKANMHDLVRLCVRGVCVVLLSYLFSTSWKLPVTYLCEKHGKQEGHYRGEHGKSTQKRPVLAQGSEPKTVLLWGNRANHCASMLAWKERNNYNNSTSSNLRLANCYSQCRLVGLSNP